MCHRPIQRLFIPLGRRDRSTIRENLRRWGAHAGSAVVGDCGPPGQLADLTGVEASGPFAISKAAFVVLHPSQMVVESLLVGGAAIAILVLLARTGLRMMSALVALAVSTMAVALFGWDDVATVSDVGAIPSGLPLPEVPDLSAFSLGIFVGAVAVAAIVLVQGAGVRESLPGRASSDPNRDFLAQGLGNVASGLFQGQPVGGSVGLSALNRSAGARTPLASVFSGIWMVLILLAFSASSDGCRCPRSLVS
jgi:SulP family sulfate permease